MIGKRNDYITQRRFIYKKQSANNGPGRAEIRTGRAGPTLTIYNRPGRAGPGRTSERAGPKYSGPSTALIGRYLPNFMSVLLKLLILWKNNNWKGRLDTILNILISAKLADSGKCSFIRDLNRKVLAKFYLCTVKIIDFMKKTIIEIGGWTPSWISLSAQQMQILASTDTLWTFIWRSVPNFSFVKPFSNETIK